MSYAFIPVFDDEANPKDVWGGKCSYCRTCKHKDCEEVRRLRESKCAICGKQFKAQEKYTGSEKGNVHFSCLLEQEGC